MKRLLVFLLLIGIFPAWRAAEAQQAAEPPPGYQPRFEHLTVDDGLLSAEVLALVQDQAGFMWIGTQDGLNRYDGRNLVAYRHKNDDPTSISGNYILALALSRDGHLWIGTDPTGLNELDPSTGVFTAYRHDPANPDSLSNDSVWAVYEDSQGMVWVGTRNGLNRFDRQTGRFKAYLPDAANPRALSHPWVLRIYQDRAGVVWVATRAGLNRYDPASDDFTVYLPDEADPAAMRPNLGVWDVYEDSQKVLWLATRGGGLQTLDRATGAFSAYQHNPADPTSLSDNNVWKVYEDQHGNLWVGTEKGGINRFNRASGQFTAYRHDPNDPLSLLHNDIFWLTEDRSGVLWAASRRGGVSRFSPAMQRFAYFRNIPGADLSLNVNYVSGIIPQADGVLWVGTQGGGLNRLDRQKRTSAYFRYDAENPNSLPNDSIYDMYLAPDDTLWIATEGGGLSHFDPSTAAFTNYRNEPDQEKIFLTNYITDIEPAGAGRLWVGTLGYGLELFDPATGQATHFVPNADDPTALSEGTINALATDGDGRLWIGTARGGANRYNPVSGVFERFTHDASQDDANQILDNTVNDIYISPAGFVWFANIGGLSRYDPATDTFRHFTESNGLPDATIYSIQPDLAGNLWLGTGKGLVRLGVQDESIFTYDLAHGIQSNKFNIYAAASAPDGEMFLGGPGGLTAFYPRQLTASTYQPPIVLTSISSSHAASTAVQPVHLPKTYSFVYLDNLRLELSFAALDYLLPAKVQYQYRLEGFDDDWSKLGGPAQAAYTALPPGRYTFWARAINQDGALGQAVPLAYITILPAWWQTLWFRTLQVFLVMLLVLALVWLRTYAVQKQNRILERNVAERTSQLAAVNHNLQLEIARRESIQSELERQARTDSLTGIYNRRYFYELATVEFARASRYQRALSVLMLDLDHFKCSNDSYGHSVGDRVLITLARLMRENLRSADIYGRYGGEEFIILMPETDLAHAMRVAERLRCCVEEQSIIDENGGEVVMTVSTGVVDLSLCPTCHNLDVLIDLADRSLYKAKQLGRNRVETIQPLDSFSADARVDSDPSI